jgi:pyruvate formate lyase activating enzyme
MNISGEGSTEASFYSLEAGKVRCSLCPHSCLISEGKRGICGVREHRKGRLYSLIYGLASSIHPDPIEKKPLFHFLPGSTAISFGSVGCNLACTHCQNYSISRARPEDFGLTKITPAAVVGYARSSGASSVSWTYNEPTIWHEFTTEASKAAHEARLKTSYVTNGYIQEGPLRELKGVIDAMNIDVKAFRDTFYKEVCGGRLDPVLRAVELALELGIHVELTYLIIPGLNDSDPEISDFCKWVRDSLRVDVPIHFSAFHPDYRMNTVSRTPMSTMQKAYDLAKSAGLEHVYLGNVHAGGKDDTYCPKCGTVVVERDGFFVVRADMKAGNCSRCGAPLNMIV